MSCGTSSIIYCITEHSPGRDFDKDLNLSSTDITLHPFSPERRQRF